MADWGYNQNSYSSGSVSTDGKYWRVRSQDVYCAEILIALIIVSTVFGLFVCTILVYCSFKCCCPTTLKRTRPGIILGRRDDAPVILPVGVTSVPVLTEVGMDNPSAIFTGLEMDNDRSALLPPALELT